MRKLGLLILTLTFSMPGFSIDKKEIENRYKGKYLVVLQEGLSIGIGRLHPGEGIQGVRVEGDQTELYTLHTLWEGSLSPDMQRIGDVVPEPLHAGEIVHVLRMSCCPHDAVELLVQSVALHSATRGIGAYAHENLEQGRAELQFVIPNKTDYAAAAANIEKWLKPFDSPEGAAAFGKGMGNISSPGVFVKEVKLGMTPAEVEAVMGVPVSKADLGEKMLYKYKDMTIEFHDGKVADVR